jgi:hypothetical protein
MGGEAFLACGTDQILQHLEGGIFGQFLKYFILQLLIGERQQAHGLCQVGGCYVSERLIMYLKHFCASSGTVYSDVQDACQFAQ